MTINLFNVLFKNSNSDFQKSSSFGSGRSLMLNSDCCHRRPSLMCVNMVSAKRKLVLVMCCACICCCSASTSAPSAPSENVNDVSASPISYSRDADSFSDSLFRKYGGVNGFMTIQEFEMLVSNLGLLKHVNASQHQNEINIHANSDKNNNNTAHQKDLWHDVIQQQDFESANRCLNTYEIEKIVKNHNEKFKTSFNVDLTKDFDSNNKISSTVFEYLCFALIYEMDRKSCYSDLTSITNKHMLYDNNISLHNQVHDAYNMKSNDSFAPKLHLAWLYASISIIIISASGLLGVAIVPFSRSPAYPQLLRFLVALAVGTLCGDALMHLLPHALMPHDHSHGTSSSPEDHHTPMYKCGLTFLTILLFYALEALLPIFNNGLNLHNHGHGNGHGHAHELKPELGSMLTTVENNTKKEFSPIALMIILGDSLHNLTDGLAIGAAFSNDSVTGIATSIAVLCHELPHEFGDFAVLLRVGYSVKRVLYFNVMSSILSFIGMAIGLLVTSGHAAASQWIYAATAGSFLYIALADLVPEMAEGNKNILSSTLTQICGISLGGAIMLLIALNEDSLRLLFL